jgi:thiamine pyrophosphokinase
MLSYNTPVIAIGGSDIDKAAVSPLLGHFPLIAADSGANTATTMGVMPDHIIGDFDSIGDMTQFPPDRLIHMAEQDNTDLEKTLSCLSVPLCLGFGFLGRRFDHSLAALHAIARSQVPVILIGQHDALVYCKADFTASLPSGERFSVWPLIRHHFKMSKGLEWPLNGLSMEAGQLIGTSNRISKQTDEGLMPVHISSAGGKGYFIMIASRYWPHLAATMMQDNRWLEWC